MEDNLQNTFDPRFYRFCGKHTLFKTSNPTLKFLVKKSFIKPQKD